MELGRIELPSVRWMPGLLRPFPSLRLAAAATPGRADHKDPAAGSFSGVSGLCRLSAGLSPPSTAASVARLQRSGPRVPLLVAMILEARSDQATRTRASSSASLWVPRLRSLSNSGRTPRLPGPDVETGQPRVPSFFKHRPLRGPNDSGPSRHRRGPPLTKQSGCGRERRSDPDGGQPTASAGPEPPGGPRSTRTP